MAYSLPWLPNPLVPLLLARTHRDKRMRWHLRSRLRQLPPSARAQRPQRPPAREFGKTYTEIPPR
eukprot:3980000-Pleurochrysis_carterae.AAC.1